MLENSVRLHSRRTGLFDFSLFSGKFVFTNFLKMKVMHRMLSVLVALAMAVSLTNCDDDKGGGKSEEEAQLEKLVGTWTLTSATLDGDSRTTDFPGLTLTLSGTFTQGGTYSYSFTGTRPNPSPWPESGTWKFDSNPNSQIIRLNDSQKMNYSLGNGNSQLTIEFNYQGGGFAGGRVEEVNGNWQFVFTK
jgi:hypothetical protein